MTAVTPRPVVTRPWPVRRQVRGSALTRILRTTDAKQIGIMYMVTAFVFFLLGGVMALLMRDRRLRAALMPGQPTGEWDIHVIGAELPEVDPHVGTETEVAERTCLSITAL